MSGPIDLSQLPPPNVVEPLDFEGILAERKASFLSHFDEEERKEVERTLQHESEPLTKLLQENAYRELMWRQRVNEAARAVMLPFSRDEDLDSLVANFRVERQVIDPGDPGAVPPIPPVRESNNRLRMRAQQAWEGLSVAGPEAAYVYHALSSDGRVADATAISPTPAVVVVSILSTEGDGSAATDLLEIVDAYLSAEERRPVGDRLIVQSAEIVEYQVEATLFLYPGPEQGPVLEAAQSSLHNYINEQRRLGRDIRISAIHAALHVPGVQRVELASPAADLVLDKTQASRCTNIAITYGGTDE